MKKLSQPKKVSSEASDRFTVFLPQDVVKMLLADCEEQDRTHSQMVRFIVIQHYKHASSELRTARTAPIPHFPDSRAVLEPRQRKAD